MIKRSMRDRPHRNIVLKSALDADHNTLERTSTTS
jgi:hypothetical protein